MKNREGLRWGSPVPGESIHEARKREEIIEDESFKFRMEWQFRLKLQATLVCTWNESHFVTSIHEWKELDIYQIVSRNVPTGHEGLFLNGEKKSSASLRQNTHMQVGWLVGWVIGHSPAGDSPACRDRMASRCVGAAGEFDSLQIGFFWREFQRLMCNPFFCRSFIHSINQSMVRLHVHSLLVFGEHARIQ